MMWNAKNELREREKEKRVRKKHYDQAKSKYLYSVVNIQTQKYPCELFPLFYVFIAILFL